MIQGLDSIFKQFNITPHNLSLYEMAFTHSSYTNEHPMDHDYERLEFLGDSILDMVIGDFLYQSYPDVDEGQLSKMRAALVESKTLTDFSENVYGFASLVRYSVGEKGNTRFHHHINEDVFESFIGAVYLDQGYLFVRKLLADIYKPLIVKAADMAFHNDPKSSLQELLNSDITYVVTSQTNLNTPNVEYVVEARVGGTTLGVGKGHNTAQAETNAAQDALTKKVGN
jgi:ribonuclease-3